MNIETLYELKAKYEREALVVEAKIEVVNDLIEAEIKECTDKEIVEFQTEQAEYSATENVM
jgi:hypothetical protein